MVASFVVVVALGAGGCAWQQVDPHQQSRSIVQDHVDGQPDRIVGSYLHHRHDDTEAEGDTDESRGTRVDNGWILAIPMDDLLGLRIAATDVEDSPSDLFRNTPQGTSFTVDRSWFADLGGLAGAVEDGYFELPAVPHGRYLVCHALPADDATTHGRTRGAHAFRGVHTSSRPLHELDRLAAPGSWSRSASRSLRGLLVVRRPLHELDRLAAPGGYRVLRCARDVELDETAMLDVRWAEGDGTRGFRIDELTPDGVGSR